MTSLNLHDLGRHLDNCKFDPETFVSAIIHLHSPHCQVSIFSNGKMNIAGLKTEIAGVMAFRKVAFKIKNLGRKKINKMKNELKMDRLREKWNEMEEDERDEIEENGYGQLESFEGIDSIDLDEDDLKEIESDLTSQIGPDFIDYWGVVEGIENVKIGSISGSAQMIGGVKTREFSERYPDNVDDDEEIHSGYVIYRRRDMAKGVCRIYPNGAINILGVKNVEMLGELFDDLYEKLTPFQRGCATREPPPLISM